MAASQDPATPNLQAAERRVRGALIAVFVLALALGALSLWRTSRRPTLGPEGGFKNLLLVTFDTTRADHVGAYGYLQAHTPNIDRMARNGVTFDQCIAVAPITLPSHTSILTGLYPFNHGARNNGTHFVPEDVTTVAETLAESDFVTGAVVSAMVLDSKYGLDQGFHVYDDNLANADKAPMFMFRETQALDTAKRALRWIQMRGAERWFLWVHFFDPHANYDAPEAFAELCPDSAYDGEIAYADAGLGEVLEGLRRKGLIEETLVVMTADHGEALGDHGESTHSMFIYDSTVRVPLVMMHPALAPGKRLREVVSSVDIVPTALELLAVAPGAALDGRSTAQALFDPHRSLDPSPAYSEAMSPYYNHGWSDLRGVRGERVRYIRAPTPEAYDLARDPWEQDNLLPQHMELAPPREAILDGWLAGGERDVRGDDILTMDPDQRAALAALGYVWSADGSEDLADSERPDPKDGVHLWEKSRYAHGLIRAGLIEEAEAALLEVLEEDPHATLTRSAYVGVLMKQDRLGDAHIFQMESLQLPGARNTSWLKMATLERKMGLESWRTYLEQAKAIDPRDPLPLVREGDWAQEDGDPEGAIAAYQAALALDHRFAKAWVGIGNTEHRRGNEEQALKVLRRATEVDPINVEAWYNLGVVLEALDREGQAKLHYEQAIELDPEQVLALVNLGNLAAEAKDDATAEAYYRRALATDAENFSAVFNLAVLLIRTDRPQEAEQLLSRGVTLEPERPEAWHYWTVAARRSGNHEAVLASAEGFLAVSPGHAGAMADAAVALLALNRPDEARAYLARGFAADPEAIRARAARSEGLGLLLESLE